VLGPPHCGFTSPVWARTIDGNAGTKRPAQMHAKMTVNRFAPMTKPPDDRAQLSDLIKSEAITQLPHSSAWR
jgi:hypothetical protein